MGRSGSGGQVRQRPNGTWEGRYWQDGRKRSVYAKGKREAQEKLRAALLNAQHGIRPVTARTTVGQWLEEWLTTSVVARCRPRTVESYRETVERYIAPAIGRVPLAKLEARDVERMLARLTARGTLSPSTVRYSYSILRIALGRALKAGRVLRNVCELLDPPSKATREMRPLTLEQAQAFVEATAEDRLGPLYSLAIATGLRQGELLALRWRDVDLDRGWLAIRHTLRRGARVLAEPKTERARRTLRLGDSAMAVLREQRRRQGTIDPEAYVFATATGRPLDSRNVTQDLQAALLRAGLPRQRFHDLRHLYATLMLEDGEELAIVSRSLGHSDLSTTANVYAHLTPAMLERSAARMDTILARRAEVATG